MKETIIKVEDVTVAYDVKPVVWDIDTEFSKGKITAIVGPNGAGKSTLVKAVMGIIQPISGTVKIMTQKGIGDIAYVPQSGSVDWDFPATVEDIVLMGRYGHLGWFKRPTKNDQAISLAMIEKVGMSDFKNRQIRQLSGGQQQRVFLARALAQEAEIYILDEPLKGVDAKTEAILMVLLRELANEGKTVIAVHHDLTTVAKYFDEVALVNVKLVAHGDVKTVFTTENIDKTFGVLKGGDTDGHPNH